MTPSRSQHGKTHKSNQVSTLAKSLAPEDICAGDYVSILHVVYEFPALVWCDDNTLIDHNKIIHLPLVPSESSGEPLQVIVICLPFVLVKHPCGKKRPLDIRNCRLARLDRTYAKTACKAYQTTKPKKKRRKKKNC